MRGDDLPADVVSQRPWAWIVVAMAAGIPAVGLRISSVELDPVLSAVLMGIGIVGGAFLISWAAEVAQVDISASLAIAILALVALLPEYAIETVLAWQAGASFDPLVREVTPEMQRVAANVTGSNRLLIGVGWSLVILIFWLKRRRSLDLRGHLSLELGMLVAATLVTLLLFFMQQVNIVVAVVLIAMYVFYLWASSRRPSEEPDLMGVALMLGALPAARRRASVGLLFLFAAAVILMAAEPFVDALVHTGLDLGIDEFILIQWIAPLASESPEIIVAVLFTLRANPTAGLTTLISAEVNQLTVLVGSMAIIFSLSAGQVLSFPLDPRQSAEFLLTSAVSAFAILLVAPRLMSWKSGAALLLLFIVHLFFVDTGERLIFAYIYFGLAAGLAIVDRRGVLMLVRGASQ